MNDPNFVIHSPTMPHVPPHTSTGSDLAMNKRDKAPDPKELSFRSRQTINEQGSSSDKSYPGNSKVMGSW